MANMFDVGTSRESKVTDASATTAGTSTRQRVLSQEAIDKLLYDVLSQDQGLAQLLSGEGMMGGSGSSSKTMMAQDFMAKALGELAILSAPETTTTLQQQDSTQKTVDKKSSGGVKTVICTALMNRGLLDPVLYAEGEDHFHTLSLYTVAGYRTWADWVVRKMGTSPRLVSFFTPIARSRYLMTSKRKRFTFLGALTIYLGQPICWLIGRVLIGKELAMQIATESR